MASVQGPLFSLAASGKLAGAVVFRTWKGRPVVAGLAKPSNPKSDAQVAVRAAMRFLSQQWANLTAPEKASWDDLAASLAVSPINAFQQINAKRFTQFQYPLVDREEAAGTAPVMGALTATPGVGQISISHAITTPNDIWGMIVTASMSTGYTPGRTNTRFIAAGTASPITCVLTGLAAGNWYVRCAGFNRGGTGSVFVAESAAIAVT